MLEDDLVQLTRLSNDAADRALALDPDQALAHLVKDRTEAELYEFYIDMRTNQKDYEEFYQRLLDEGVHFVRGKVSEVTDAARSESERARAAD